MLGKVGMPLDRASAPSSTPKIAMTINTTLPRRSVMSNFHHLLQRRDRAGLVILATLFLGLICFLGMSPPFHAADKAKSAEAFELKPGDHVCIIGNTLADRMQHDGWLETYLHSRFPTHQLTIRNMGFSGDELTLRLRSQDFGTPEQW